MPASYLFLIATTLLLLYTCRSADPEVAAENFIGTISWQSAWFVALSLAPGLQLLYLTLSLMLSAIWLNSNP